MKIGFIQYDVNRNRNENFVLIERYLCEIDCEIIVLPELCVCGYLFEDRQELKSVAETVSNSLSIDIIKNLSKKHNCAIIFGMAELEDNNIYNTAIIIDNGSFVGKYRKIHLSDLEKKLFNRGTNNEVFEVCGITIGVQICFDLWFPEMAREQIRKGADLLCVLANFGGETTYNIAQTRAIENLTPIVLCNRVGSEKTSSMNATFLGKSTVIDSTGTHKIIGKSGTESARCCEIELQKEKSNVICKNFDVEIDFHYTNGQIANNTNLSLKPE